MALKHRLADASYRLLDCMGHKPAFESAGRSVGVADFAGLHGRKHALLADEVRAAAAAVVARPG